MSYSFHLTHLFCRSFPSFLAAMSQRNILTTSGMKDTKAGTFLLIINFVIFASFVVKPALLV